jgi:hypothetical protein
VKRILILLVLALLLLVGIALSRALRYGSTAPLVRFTGVRAGDRDETRDGLLTRIWSFTMDALAIGLCMMVATAVYLWYQLGQRRQLGLLALGSGVVCRLFFVFGLAHIF